MQLKFDDEAAEVRRRFDASPAIVFTAFADSNLVQRWLKPSPEVTLEVLSYDFSPGGQYRFAYRTPGEPLMHVNGVFASIDPPSRIVFSWNIEPPDPHAGIRSEVRISLTPADGATDVLIQHVKLSRPGAPQRHAEGWDGAMDRLAAWLADLPEHA